MNITTDNKALKELLETGKTTDKVLRKLPKGVVDGFVKAVGIIRRVKRIEGLYVHKGLNYEKLTNTGIESVRCNGKYRLTFRSYPDKGEIIITNIELFEITNHYGKI